VLGDIGGFTSDFAKVKYDAGKYHVIHRAINVAGNSIDQIRKMMIHNQLADIEITNPYVLHKTLLELKHGNKFETIFNENELFCSKIQLSIYVL